MILLSQVNDGGNSNYSIDYRWRYSRSVPRADPVALGAATKAYVDALNGGVLLDGSTDITGTIEPNTDNTHDLGSSVRNLIPDIC